MTHKYSTNFTNSWHSSRTFVSSLILLHKINAQLVKRGKLMITVLRIGSRVSLSRIRGSSVAYSDLRTTSCRACLYWSLCYPPLHARKWQSLLDVLGNVDEIERMKRVGDRKAPHALYHIIRALDYYYWSSDG